MTSIPEQESGKSGDSGFASCSSFSSVSFSMPSNMFYRMDHGSRGLLIIINNHTFDVEMPKREGYYPDNQNLKKIFEDIGFKVHIHENQTIKQMQDIVQEASKIDYTNDDCFAMAILSHGDSGMIYGTNGTIKFEDLLEPISKNKVKSLIGKPKLFFIQACRGDECDEGVESEEKYQQDAKKGEDFFVKKIPAEADFLYSYSTAPGYVSFRNKRLGSWYIQGLKNVFEEYSKEYDLVNLLTMVNNDIATKMESRTQNTKTDKKKQMPCFTSMLTKLIKFP